MACPEYTPMTPNMPEMQGIYTTQYIEASSRHIHHWEASSLEAVPLAEFKCLACTRMPGESYHRLSRSQLCSSLRHVTSVESCYPIHLLISIIFTEFSQGNVFHLPWALTRADACCVRDHGILPHQKDPHSQTATLGLRCE